MRKIEEVQNINTEEVLGVKKLETEETLQSIDSTLKRIEEILIEIGRVIFQIQFHKPLKENERLMQSAGVTIVLVVSIATAIITTILLGK